VRAFSAAPGLREEVVRFEPPSLMEYRVIQGPVPMDQHHGEVRFVPEESGHDGGDPLLNAPGPAGHGTRVTWRVSFRSRVPGLGWLLERGLTVMFGRMLGSLARDLDRRPG